MVRVNCQNGDGGGSWVGDFKSRVLLRDTLGVHLSTPPSAANANANSDPPRTNFGYQILNKEPQIELPDPPFCAFFVSIGGLQKAQL